MIDEKDLQMIAQLNAESERRMLAMMESFFEPKFNLLAEKMDILQEKSVSAKAVDDLDARLDILEGLVRVHSEEIAELEKAN